MLCMTLDFPLLAMLYSAPHTVKSPCYFQTAITLYTCHVSSLAISQMKDLFNIYSPMYDRTIFACIFSAKSEHKKFLVHFITKFLDRWNHSELPWTGYYIITLVPYSSAFKVSLWRHTTITIWANHSAGTQYVQARNIWVYMLICSS